MTEARRKRLQFRAWHRGTREADYMIGCFFDRFHGEWDEPELAWFETLIEEADVDILGWALGTLAVPAHYAGPLMELMRRLDYVEIRSRPSMWCKIGSGQRSAFSGGLGCNL